MGIYSDFTTFFNSLHFEIIAFARHLPITPALPVTSETCPLPLDYSISFCMKSPSIAIVLLPGAPERPGQGSPEEDLQLPAPLWLDLGLLTPALGLLLGGPHTLPSIQTTVFMQRLSIQNLRSNMKLSL